MKRLVLLLILAGSVSLSQTAPVGIVQGIVTRLGTNEPLADVQISILPGVAAPATAPIGPAQASPLGAISDAGGRFVILNVPAGRVTVRAQRSGHFGPPVNGLSVSIPTTAVEVIAGQAVEVRFGMAPGGTITGRVLDQNGRPLQDVQVRPRAIVYAQGALTLQSSTERITDDRGEYRLFGLAPGEYYISASPRASAFRIGTGAGTVQESLIQTFHPNVTDLATALPVAVRSGDQISGIDIRLRTSNTYRISGKVASTLPPGPVLRRQDTSFGAAGTVRPPIALVALVPHDALSLGDYILSFQATVKDDNTFEIRNVLPGVYDLIAELPVNQGWGQGNPPEMALAPVAYGKTTIEVRDGNLDDVTVLVHQGVDVKGNILVDGKRAPAALKISLRPESPREATSTSYRSILDQVAQYEPAIGPDGSFTIPLLPEGRYRVQVTSGAPQIQTQSTRLNQPGPPVRGIQSGLQVLPPTTYVSDIRQGGVSVYDSGLSVGVNELAPIEVLINTDGGSIQGLVTGSDRKPAANIPVVLVPGPTRRQNPDLYKTARSDSEGRFTFQSVPPGLYKLFAAHSVQPGAYQNPRFITAHEEQGIPVAVPSRQMVSVTLTLNEQ